jgi:apolipoprotein N-acyltransferase
LSAAFPKLSISLIAYVALIPFIIDLQKTSSHSTSKLFLKGITFGFPFLLIQHTCLLPLIDFSTTGIIIFAWVGYSLILSIYWGIFTIVYKKLGSKLWTFPFLWIILEFVKALGPFGSNVGQIASTQSNLTPIAQLAWLGGPFLLSFFVVGINTLLAKSYFETILKKSTPISVNQKAKFLIALAFSTYIIVYSLGTIKITQSTETNPNIKIAIIQANHNQKKKLITKNATQLRNYYLTLSKEALNYYSPSILFFPETITPQLNLKKYPFINQLRFLLKEKSAQVLMGTPRVSKHEYFNSIVLINSEGISNNTYDKVKLFPFGEYWPYKDATKWLGFGSFVPKNDFSAAKEGLLLNVDTNKTSLLFGNAICLESMYPWHLRKQTKNGATVLFVAANHAWFQNSHAAQRHLNHSILRAIENNRFLVLAANTGISSIIDQNGKLQIQSNLNKKAIIYGTVSKTSKITPYHIVGDSIIFLSLLILGFYKVRRILK